MKFIGESYAKYFIQKYKSIKKSGHVFMGRYGRKIIDSNDYMKTLLNYIHLNPVKDYLCNNPQEHKWSSYNSYLKEQDIFNFLELFYLKEHFQKHLNHDLAEINNQLLEISKLNIESKTLIDSELMKEHLSEYLLDQNTFKKLYTYCLLEWTELNSNDLAKELNTNPTNIRKIKSNLKFELEENNHLLQNLIFNVRKSLGLF